MSGRAARSPRLVGFSDGVSTIVDGFLNHRPSPQLRWFTAAFALCGHAFAHAQAPAAGADQPEIRAPQLIQRFEAIYPADALAARQQAIVTLLVTIDASGSVSDATVAESAGEAFDKAAIAAVKQWRFEPARRGADAVVSRIRVPFQFVLPVAEVAAEEPTAQAPPAITAASVPEAPSTLSATPPTAADAGSDVEAPIDVTVHGRARPPSRGSSDYQLELGHLADVPHQNASELLKLAPGILLTNAGGEGHAEQVFMRGFDAREGQDIEFSAGGVPINEAGNLHGNGYADRNFIIPELVGSLRVLEGPFDPRQGNFAVAGSADYELGLAQRGLTAQQTFGSFGTARTLLLWGPEGTGPGTFTGVELYQTNGFGQNRDGRRGSFMTQYEGYSGPNTYRIGATAYVSSFHSAGVLREDDYQAGRVGFYDTYDHNQGEDSSRYSLNAELETKLDHVVFKNQLFGIITPMRLRENLTGFLLDPQQPIQNPHGQRGDLLELSNQGNTVGARGSARMTARALDQVQALELGYFARGDFVSSSQQRIEAATGHPYHTDTDLDAQLGDFGVYGDLDLRANAWLAVRGGVRADLFTFDVLNNCAVSSVSHPSRSNPPGDVSCLSQQDFGDYREPNQRASTTGTASSPRVSVIVGPFEGLGLSAAYGRGIRSIDPIYITQDAKTPFASASSVEAGLSFDRKLDTVSLGARSSFFQTRVDKDLIFSETAGRNVLGGPTTRTGNASTLRMTGGFFDVSANATVVRAVFKDTSLLIPYIPDFVFRFDGTLFSQHLLPQLQPGGKPLRGTLSTGVTFVSPRPLPQGERGDTLFTTDLNASLGWSIFDLTVTCTNLFDAQYRLGEYNYASDFHSAAPFPTLVPVRHFSAGAPRALYVSLAVRLGGNP